jgi:hypothetical protein
LDQNSKALNALNAWFYPKINEELLTEAQRSSGCRTDEFVAKFGNFISLEELTQQKEQDI